MPALTRKFLSDPANLDLGGKRERVIFDDDVTGFALRVRVGGSIRWVFQFRDKISGKPFKKTIGDVRALSPDEARTEARKLWALVELGQNPAVAKRNAKADAKVTMGSLIDKYLADKRSEGIRPRTYAAIKEHLAPRASGLKQYWQPFLDKPVSQITRQMINNRMRDMIVETVAADGTTTFVRGIRSAEKARKVLHAFFEWAIREGVIPNDINPVSKARQPKSDQYRENNERNLSMDELVQVWRACGDDDFGRIVKLLILTGKRRDEIAGLRWSEINFANGYIRLPRERIKNGNHPKAQDDFVPITEQMLRVVHSVPRRANNDYLFGRAGYTGFSHGKAALDTQVVIPAWKLHDLRRTFASRIADQLDVLPHLVEALLNHIKKGLEGVYNKAEYMKQKRDALILWGEYVDELVSAELPKVVPIQKAA